MCFGQSLSAFAQHSTLLLLQVAALQAEYEAKIKSLKGLKETAMSSSRQQTYNSQVPSAAMSDLINVLRCFVASSYPKRRDIAQLHVAGRSR